MDSEAAYSTFSSISIAVADRFPFANLVTDSAYRDKFLMIKITAKVDENHLIRGYLAVTMETNTVRHLTEIAWHPFGPRERKHQATASSVNFTRTNRRKIQIPFQGCRKSNRHCGKQGDC